MTKLYLIRHGECENNVKHIWGGDSELTEKGESQAGKIAQYLKDFEFKTIYYSPRKRAVKTAEIITRARSPVKYPVQLVQVPELRERNYGELEGLTLEETEKRFPGMKPKGGAALYYGKIGGENYEDIRNRVRGFLERLKSEKDCSAVVAHQMVNRAILGELLNLPIEEIPFIVTPNDMVYEMNLDSSEVWNIRNGVRKEGLGE